MLFLICPYFLPIFYSIFHNTVMIYNTRNRSNYSTESQKKAPDLILMQEESEARMSNLWKQIWLKGIYSWNKIWSLKSLVMLKCESRTSLYAIQYKPQPGSVLMFCPYYFRNGQPRHFVHTFCGTVSLALFLACS